MDQHSLSSGEAAQVFHGVRRSQKCDRQSRGLFKAQPCRLGRHELGPGHDMTAEGGAGDRQDRVADSQLAHALADGRDPAAALGTQGNRSIGKPRVHPQGLHDVTEINAGGRDLDLDFLRARPPPRQPLQCQPIERARPAHRQPEQIVRPGGASHEPVRNIPGGNVAPDVPLAPAPGYFVLLVRAANVLNQRIRSAVNFARIKVHQPGAQPGAFTHQHSPEPDRRRLGNGRRLATPKHRLRAPRHQE